MHSILVVLLAFGFPVHSAVLKTASMTTSSNESSSVSLHTTRHRRSSTEGSLSINPKITKVASETSSFQMTVRIYNKAKVFLQITPDGTVNGTIDCSSRFVEMKLLSVGRGLQHLQGVATGRYVAMNREGVVYSSSLPTDETVFRETMQSTSYHTFASAAYYRTTLYDTFLGIGRNGRTKNGKQTARSQNKVKFLIISRDSC